MQARSSSITLFSLRRPDLPQDAAYNDPACRARSDSNGARFGQVHTLTQGISSEQKMHELPRETNDDSRLGGESQAGHLVWQLCGIGEKFPGLGGKRLEARPQLRRGLAPCQRLDADAVSGKLIERDVDAVERPIVVGAVLQMVDDLQCRAQGIRRRPSRSGPHRARRARSARRAWRSSGNTASARPSRDSAAC